jgi:hypothetical protein
MIALIDYPSTSFPRASIRTFLSSFIERLPQAFNGAAKFIIVLQSPFDRAATVQRRGMIAAAKVPS